MTNRVPLSVTDLSFDGIKQSLKDFLKTQNSPIKDYNYEGSAFNIILDTLAVNAHYQSLYMNMVANEMFLDSGLLRSSIVSKAKELGYIPRSAKASVAKISLSVTPELLNVSTLLVPKLTRFQTNSGDNTYSYYNLFEESLTWNGSAYVGEFYVYAGTSYEQTVVYEEGTRIYLDADNIDTSTLVVKVQESAFNTTEFLYTNKEKIIDVVGDSRVFFLYETDLKRYEVKFGDGVFGKALSNGNVIKLSFLSVNLDAVYGSEDFLPPNDLFNGMNKTCSIVIPSSGSFTIEDIESIRQNAQRYNQAQNRSVIANDYNVNIRQEFPDVIDVTVWGGEQNDPPVYGKVFVSLVMQDLTKIPLSRKLDIISKVKEKATMNIRPEVVDPEYFTVVVSGFVRFKTQQIGISSQELKELITATLESYSSTNLEGFGRSLAFSQLSNTISAIDSSIFSVVFEFSTETLIGITSTADSLVNKKYRNPLVKGTIRSSFYTKLNDNSFTYFLKDVNGNIEEWKFTGSDDTLAEFSKVIGTVDYSTGFINGTGLRGLPTSGGNSLVLYADIDSSEIVPGFNQVLLIDSAKSSGKIEVKGS